jgi:hypothetical protein
MMRVKEDHCMPKAEWVEMTHPDHSDWPPATVSRNAYNQTWKAAGWKLAKPDKKPTRKDTD